MGPVPIQKRRSGGFTLIELLVAIAIVGLLAGTITATTANARRVARDRRRIIDIQLVNAAVTQYRQDYGVLIRPIEYSQADGQGCESNSEMDCSCDGSFVHFLQATGYLDQNPVDPLQTQCSATEHVYYFGAFGYPFTSGPSDYRCEKPFYVLIARLETDGVTDARNDQSCWNGPGSAQAEADFTYVIVGR